jgi:hypothetical protein
VMSAWPLQPCLLNRVCLSVDSPLFPGGEDSLTLPLAGITGDMPDGPITCAAPPPRHTQLAPSSGPEGH